MTPWQFGGELLRDLWSFWGGRAIVVLGAIGALLVLLDLLKILRRLITMPFKKGDPATLAAARKGGQSGDKFFATASKRKLKVIAKKGGVARQEARRQKELEKATRAAEKHEQKIMSTYLT